MKSTYSLKPSVYFVAALLALLALQNCNVQASAIVAKVPSNMTWYDCSNTSDIKQVAYNLTVLNGTQTTVNDVGTVVTGYQTALPPGTDFGVFVVLLTQTNLNLYIDPTSTGGDVKAEGSCYDVKPDKPVMNCDKSSGVGLSPDTYCLAVSNYNNITVYFGLDLFFDGVIVPPNATSSSHSSTPTSTFKTSPPTSTTPTEPPSTTSSATPSSGAGSIGISEYFGVKLVSGMILIGLFTVSTFGMLL